LRISPGLKAELFPEPSSRNILRVQPELSGIFNINKTIKLLQKLKLIHGDQGYNFPPAPFAAAPVTSVSQVFLAIAHDQLYCWSGINGK